eukprot:2241834-Prymnesium_polylepis.1
MVPSATDRPPRFHHRRRRPLCSSTSARWRRESRWPRVCAPVACPPPDSQGAVGRGGGAVGARWGRG